MKKTTLFTLFFVAFVGFVSPLFGASDSDSKELQRKKLEAEWERLIKDPEMTNTALKQADTEVVVYNAATGYDVEIIYTQRGQPTLAQIPAGRRVSLGNSKELAPIIGIKTISKAALEYEFERIELNPELQKIKFSPEEYALITLGEGKAQSSSIASQPTQQDQTGWLGAFTTAATNLLQTGFGKWKFKITAEKEVEALRATSGDTLFINPSSWPINLTYTSDNKIETVTVPAFTELNLGKFCKLSGNITIQSAPMTGIAAAQMLYSRYTFDLRKYLPKHKLGNDAYIEIKLNPWGATWDINLSFKKTSDALIAVKIVDAFRMYSENNKHFKYANRFAKSLASGFAIKNNSYWPLDLIYFENQQAYKVPIKKGQTILLDANISNYIAVKARPITTTTIASLLGVEYQYHILDISKYAQLQENLNQELMIYQIDIKGRPGDDWDLDITKFNPLHETEQTPAKAISITWPEKLGWSKKSYVRYGKMLNDAILSGEDQSILAVNKLFLKTFPEQPQKQMVKALILYYHTLAQQLGHIFEEGTFIIHGGVPIYNFLAKLNDKYTRNSSHLNALAKYQNRPWLAQLGKQHFGYDVEMPEINFSTILFNRINASGNAFYLKPESHGTAGLLDTIGHGISFIQAQGRKLAPEIFGSDDQATYSKERIPKDILKSYMAIIEKIESLSDGEKKTLSENAVSWGIKAMYQSAQNLLKKNPNKELEAFVKTLEKAQVGDIKKSYLDKRIGSEVILTPKEFEQKITILKKNNSQDASSNNSSSSSSSNKN